MTNTPHVRYLKVKHRFTSSAYQRSWVGSTCDLFGELGSEMRQLFASNAPDPIVPVAHGVVLAPVQPWGTPLGDQHAVHADVKAVALLVREVLASSAVLQIIGQSCGRLFGGTPRAELRRRGLVLGA